jgi:hypothetical protein
VGPRAGLDVSGKKYIHKIITQYTKDRLQLATMHIVKTTQGEESTVLSF